MFFTHVWHLDTLKNPYFHDINSGKHLMPVNQSKLSSLQLCSHSFQECLKLAIVLHLCSNKQSGDTVLAAEIPAALILLKLHNYMLYCRIKFTLCTITSFSHQTYSCAVAKLAFHTISFGGWRKIKIGHSTLATSALHVTAGLAQWTFHA